MAFKNHFLSKQYSTRHFRRSSYDMVVRKRRILAKWLCTDSLASYFAALSNVPFPGDTSTCILYHGPLTGSVLTFTDFVFASFNFYLTVLVKYSLWTTKVQYFWWKTSCTIWNVYFPSINSMIWFWRLPFLDFFCLSVDPLTFLFSSADISRWCFKKPPTLYTIWPIWVPERSGKDLQRNKQQRMFSWFSIHNSPVLEGMRSPWAENTRWLRFCFHF